MDKLEKVERLRNSAQVSYEEALTALDACGGDLLDAMVLLEKQGKTGKPEQTVYSTSGHEQQKAYVSVSEKVEEQKNSAPSFSGSLRSIIRKTVRFVKGTSFRIRRHDREMFEMPSWVALIVVIILWKIILPAAVIALLFGFRFSLRSYDGSENTDAANSILSKAGELADDVTESFRDRNKEK